MKHRTEYLLLAFAIAAASGCNADRTPADDTNTPPPQASEPATPPADTTPPPTDTPPGPSPPDDTASVPARFQGNWASDATACAAAGHESRLTIGAERIQFHESSGAITSVASGGNDVTITAQLTGEGETREATYRFRLSDDGEVLTDLGGGMERVRCD